MPNTFKSSFFNLGTTADTNLYTTGLGVTTLVKSVYIANTGTADAINVSISVGPTGGTAAYLIKNAIVPIQTSFQPITEPIVLEANDRINAQTSTLNVTDIVLSYLEIT
jgi:hypothetical protein